MRHAANALAVLLFVGTAAGCATSSALRKGDLAEQRQDYDMAVVEYTKAVKEKPDAVEPRARLERARLRASLEHFNRGRRLAGTGKFDQALVEYELAADLNPANGEIDTELRRTRDALRAKAQLASNGRTQLENLIQQAREL